MSGNSETPRRMYSIPACFFIAGFCAAVSITEISGSAFGSAAFTAFLSYANFHIAWLNWTDQ